MSHQQHFIIVWKQSSAAVTSCDEISGGSKHFQSRSEFFFAWVNFFKKPVKNPIVWKTGEWVEDFRSIKPDNESSSVMKLLRVWGPSSRAYEAQTMRQPLLGLEHFDLRGIRNRLSLLSRFKKGSSEGKGNKEGLIGLITNWVFCRNMNSKLKMLHGNFNFVSCL